jgi:hypothetical protein
VAVAVGGVGCGASVAAVDVGCDSAGRDGAALPLPFCAVSWLEHIVSGTSTEDSWEDLL